jgi:hypothetical protein
MPHVALLVKGLVTPVIEAVTHAHFHVDVYCVAISSQDVMSELCPLFNVSYNKWRGMCCTTSRKLVACQVDTYAMSRGLQISITFKNAQVLKDVSWEVKKGERVGLVGAWALFKFFLLEVPPEL